MGYGEFDRVQNRTGTGRTGAVKSSVYQGNRPASPVGSARSATPQRQHRQLPMPGNIKPLPKPPASRSAPKTQPPAQKPQARPAGLNAPAGSPEWIKAVEDETYLAMYREFAPDYRRMADTPTARLVHKMSENPGSFPDADSMAAQYPEPPAASGEKQAPEAEETAATSLGDRQSLNRTMWMSLESGKENGRHIRDLVQDLGRDFSSIMSLLRSGELNRETVMRLSEHMSQLCRQGEEAKAYLPESEMLNKVVRVISRAGAFAGRVANLLQADLRADRSKKQMEQAGRGITGARNKREAGIVPEGYWGRAFNRMTEESTSRPEMIGSYEEFQESSFRPRREGKQVNGSSGRRYRLDEEIMSMRRTDRPDAPGMNAEQRIKEAIEKDRELEFFEQYDINYELARANEKRRRAGALDILVQDGIPIGKALASLDPITGRIVRGIIDALTEGGAQLKNKISDTRSEWRRWNGTNQSEEQKARRRHNLAHMMYRQLAGLRSLDILAEPIPPEQLGVTQDQVIRGRMIMDGYRDVEQNVDATGRSTQIEASRNGHDLIDNLRKGFYRDNQ